MSNRARHFLFCRGYERSTGNVARLASNVFLLPHNIRIENPVSAQPLPGSARRRGGTSEDLIDLTEDDPPLISPIPPKASEPEQVLRFPSGLPQFPADSAVFTVFDLPFRGRVNLCSYLAA